MTYAVLRHKKKPRRFLRVISDSRGDPTYHLRLVEGTLPQLLTIRKGQQLKSLVGRWRRQQMLSEGICDMIEREYALVVVTLNFHP